MKKPRLCSQTMMLRIYSSYFYTCTCISSCFAQHVRLAKANYFYWMCCFGDGWLLVTLVNPIDCFRNVAIDTFTTEPVKDFCCLLQFVKIMDLDFLWTWATVQPRWAIKCVVLSKSIECLSGKGNALAWWMKNEVRHDLR